MGGSTKQALLQALSAAEGAYISGQQLAEALGVTIPEADLARGIDVTQQ